MMSTLFDLARAVDPYVLGAGLACAVCALSVVAFLRALPARLDPVTERLSTPPMSARSVGNSFWTYRVTEARDG